MAQYQTLAERYPHLFPNGVDAFINGQGQGQIQGQNPQPQSNPLAGQIGQMGGQLLGRQGAKYIAGAIKGSGAAATGSGAAVSAGATVIPAGATVPAGFTAVGTSATGGTVVAPTAASGGSLGSITMAGAVPVAGAVVGGALLGKGIKDLYTGKDTKGVEGWGGRATLGIASGGLSEVARATGLLGRQPSTRVEEEKWKKLGEQGYTVPQWVKDGVDIKDKNAWFRDDLDKDFIGKDSQGNWVNNKFANSRDKDDLRGNDIRHFAAFQERYGKLSDEQQGAIADESLRRKLVDEGDGSITIKDDEGMDEFVKNWKPASSSNSPPSRSNLMQEEEQKKASKLAQYVANSSTFR